jgi:hypothetical protein
MTGRGAWRFDRQMKTEYRYGKKTFFVADGIARYYGVLPLDTTSTLAA